MNRPVTIFSLPAIASSASRWKPPAWLTVEASIHIRMRAFGEVVDGEITTDMDDDEVRAFLSGMAEEIRRRMASDTLDHAR